MKTRVVMTAALAGAALLAPLGAAAQPDAPPWKFSVMPYLWLPSGLAGFEISQCEQKRVEQCRRKGNRSNSLGGCGITLA